MRGQLDVDSGVTAASSASAATIASAERTASTEPVPAATPAGAVPTVATGDTGDRHLASTSRSMPTEAPGARGAAIAARIGLPEREGVGER